MDELKPIVEALNALVKLGFAGGAIVGAVAAVRVWVWFDARNKAEREAERKMEARQDARNGEFGEMTPTTAMPAMAGAIAQMLNAQRELAHAMDEQHRDTVRALEAHQSENRTAHKEINDSLITIKAKAGP